jgi:methionyl-tRNA synthetase
MPQTPEKFFLTTPIYYVNARPHIGHAYTTIVADVLARRHRLLGHDTYFLTGTDEHGQKIERSAAAAGIAPQAFADEVSASFRTLWDRMGLTCDQFIRTTSEEHKRGVQKLFLALQAAGAIYKDTYTGQYCVSDEAFVDVPVGAPCPDCGRVTETVSETNYYFKLSAYQQPILKLIESNQLLIQPDSRRNEVLSFLRGGLNDLSISRTSFKWGIAVPGDEAHVIYVWLDALANYMTALGYGAQDDSLWKRYWPADLHIVGKEIIRFHCVYWPAFLLAAGLPLPKQVVAHGWLLFEESKMSKSRGNIVRTETILDGFGPLCPEPADLDALSFRSKAEQSAFLNLPREARRKHHQDLFASDVLRYFLLREIPFGQDGSFSFDAMITRYNADLANGYGNITSRTLTMISKYYPDGCIPSPSPETVGTVTINPALVRQKKVLGSAQIYQFSEVLLNVFHERLDEGLVFSAALEMVSTFLGEVDRFLTAKAPWRIASGGVDSKGELASILYTAAESIRIITALLYPILPYSTASVWRQLGLGDIEEAARNGELNNLQWGGLKPGTKLGPLAPIFPRADKGLAQMMTDMESPASLTAITSQHDAHTPAVDDLPVASLASEPPSTEPLSPEPASHDPAAGPRTSTLSEPNPGAQVAGSSAETTERPPTPHHTEAPASGIFAGQPADSSPQITIDDFAKVELRVAQVVVCERIPKADKLLRLEVDLGFEKRQILSGIADWYTPEDLIGRRIVVITNLAPRKMRGLESHGMLLAASAPEGGKPALATFGDADQLPLGSRLK